MYGEQEEKDGEAGRQVQQPQPDPAAMRAAAKKIVTHQTAMAN